MFISPIVYLYEWNVYTILLVKSRNFRLVATSLTLEKTKVLREKTKVRIVFSKVLTVFRRWVRGDVLGFFVERRPVGALSSSCFVGEMAVAMPALMHKVGKGSRW